MSEFTCDNHPVEDDVFKRAVLRAAPNVIISGDQASLSLVFFDKELGETYGEDIYQKAIDCAGHIVAGECARFECEVESYLPPKFEIRERTTEPEPTELSRSERFARALGAERSVFVGRVGLLEAFSGQAQQRVAAAKKLYEIAEVEVPDNAIDKAIKRLVGLADSGRDGDTILTIDQREAILQSAYRVFRLHEQVEDKAKHATIIRTCFDIYFAYQATLTETTAGHVLRVLGDDFAIEQDFDFEEAWQLYQASLAAHESKQGYY